MYRLLVEKQMRQLSYYLCTGLALGLSHKKSIWEKQRSREWWTDIVKGTFSDGQWMEIFGMTKATFKILCDDLRPSFPDQARNDACETLCHQPFAGQEGFISFF